MAKNSSDAGIQRDRELMQQAQQKGKIATLMAFIKLSGPGWLQSAITLGGGSLAGSLYLGVLGGYNILWLQPLAMIMGVIMLSAISYVVLSTGERPFQAINRHINPVLGWGWAIATLLANCVWALPQFSLGTAAVRQNLLPNILGSGSGMETNTSKLIVCAAILVVCTAVVWSYDKGREGIKLFEIFLKILVAIIVVSFFGVVIKMSANGVLDWGKIGAGLIPDIKLLTSPATTFAPFLEAVDSHFRGYWKDIIVSQQRDVMISAAATAVGINMTFLLPYSMLKKGWDRHFRGLAIFDLSTGMFIPFILATGCVVIASATQFHGKYNPGLLGEPNAQGVVVQPKASLVAKYNKNIEARLKMELGPEAYSRLSAEEKQAKIAALPLAEKRMAAMLVKRDAFDLANSLGTLTGPVFAQYVFGIGVIGMAVSTIIILMLINGFVVCEMLGIEAMGWPYRLACFMPAVGALGPFFWKQAAFWLAVPTSVFGMCLLPIAYFTFYLMMNSRSLMGENMPRGIRRVIWNILMAIAAGLAAFASIWSIWSKAAWKGIAGLGLFIALILIVQIVRGSKPIEGKSNR